MSLLLNHKSGQMQILTEDMRRKLDDIKNSTTYKVGKALMYLPCHVKELIKRGK